MKGFDGISLLKKFERTGAWVSIAEKRSGLTGSPMKLEAVATCLLSSSHELGLLTEQAKLSFLMIQSHLLRQALLSLLYGKANQGSESK